MTPESMETTQKTAYEKAKVFTPRHFSCSLGTHLALQEALNIKDESAFRAAAGLHGGMGKGDICGSLLGASLLLGLVCGNGIEESGQPKDHPPEPGSDVPTRLVGEIYDWFEQEFGSVKCRDVRARHEQEVAAEAGGRELTDEEKMGLTHAKCDELCGKTAARTISIVWEYR